MNRRLLIVFAFALVAAACIGYLVYRVLGSRPSAAAAVTTDVVIATKNLDVGVLVTAPDLKLVKWPGAAPKGSLLKADLALNRGVISPIYEGEPVLSSRLAVAGSGAGLAALIPPGMRACAVKVDDVVGVSGFVTPGMRVDVLMSGIPPGELGNGGPRVKTLMQNIQVLSAGANLQRDNEGKQQQVQVVNLLVTPEQAETLSLASGQTRIQLVLRNPADTRVATPPGVVMGELFGGSSRLTVPPPVPVGQEMPVLRPDQPHGAPVTQAPVTVVRPAVRPALRVVEVLNGTVRTEARFERTGGVN